MAYGISFQPGQENGAGPNGEKRRAPVQEAVRMLSLRLPTVVGARGIAPQELLQSEGAAGVETGGFSLDAALDLLRKLRGAHLPPQLPLLQESPFGGTTPVSTRLPQPGRPQPQPRFETPSSRSRFEAPAPQRRFSESPSSPAPSVQPPAPPGPPRIIPGEPKPTPDIVAGPSVPFTPVATLPDPEPEASSPWLDRMTAKYEDEYHRG